MGHSLLEACKTGFEISKPRANQKGHKGIGLYKVCGKLREGCAQWGVEGVIHNCVHVMCLLGHNDARGKKKDLATFQQI